MIEALTTTGIIDLAIRLGGVGLVFLIWWFTYVGEQKRAKEARLADDQQKKEERDERDRDRREHMTKWDSLIIQQNDQVKQILNAHSSQLQAERDNHQNQLTTFYKLMERQTQSTELMAHQITVLTQDLRTNQWCPQIRTPKGDTSGR